MEKSKTLPPDWACASFPTVFDAVIPDTCAFEAELVALPSSVLFWAWAAPVQRPSVSNNAVGAPQLALSDYAAELASSLGVNHIWLSISDEQAYAAATVILERQ